MANVLDIIIKAQDQASSVMEHVGQVGSKAAQYLEANWAKIGIATAGAGMAIEGMARQQAPLTEQSRKLAAAMSITEDEVRAMAQEVAGAGDPLNEVLGVMEMGRKQGIMASDQLSKYAGFWDMVGDATGEPTLLLAESGAALRAVGIAAGEESEALAAMGYIQRETSGTVSEFLSFIGRTGPQLREMGMDVNDAAAVLGILEREFGMTGRMARTQFNQAVNEAEGDMGKLLATLGITGEQFDGYKSKVQASNDIIEENAAIHEESYTAMQKLQHAASELTYNYGDLIGVIGNLSPALMVVGPLIKGITVAKEAMAKVSLKKLVPAFVGATAKVKIFSLALLASPITWIVLGVMALIAAVVLLIKNWDKVGPFFEALWGRIKNAFSGAVTAVTGFVTNLWTGISTRFTAGITAAISFVTNFWASISAAFSTAITTVVGFVTNFWATISTRFTAGVTAAIGFVTNLWTRIRAAFSTAVTAVVGFIVSLWTQIQTRFSAGVTAVIRFVTNLWTTVRTAFSTAVTAVIGFVQNLWNGVVQRFNTLVARIRNIVAGVTEAITAPFRRARDIVSGIADRIRDSLNKINPFAKSSPSLVEAVRAGVQAIQQEYAKLERLQVPTFTAAITPAPAYAGARAAEVSSGGGFLAHQGPLFVVQNMVVRSEADVDAVSRQLYRHIQAATRARGGK